MGDYVYDWRKLSSAEGSWEHPNAFAFINGSYIGEGHTSVWYDTKEEMIEAIECDIEFLKRLKATVLDSDTIEEVLEKIPEAKY